MPSTPSVSTCLWFDGHVEEAAELYVSLLPDSRVTSVQRYPEGAGDLAGAALLVELTLAGVPFQLLNGGPHYPQTEAASIAVQVDGQGEVDRLWDALVAGGGQEGRCGWCTDRFGVSWQVVPRELGALMAGPNGGAVSRELQTMTKIDLARLEAARG